MPGQESHKTLIEAFSKSRLYAYMLPGEGIEQAFARYQNNIRLGESLVPALHYLEIILRNRLDQAIGNIYGKNWMISVPPGLRMDEGNLEKLGSASRHFQYEKRATPNHDDLVAHMAFGFWSSFFHKRYDEQLWHRKYFAAQVFPYMKHDHRSRNVTKPKLQVIKAIRNRIAHHEPIWNWKPGAKVVHTLCLELIGAMSQVAIEKLKEVDRFP